MNNFDNVDWFTDAEVHRDPYPYYEYLRAQGPAVYLPQHNCVAVTDYDEVLKVFRDNESYSLVCAVGGPFPPLPFKPEGDDITGQIEEHRPRMPAAALLMSMDPPVHTAHRALLNGLITPQRLKENEAFILRLTDKQLDSVLKNGGAFEAAKELSHPLATLVVADLLGLPEGFHQELLEMLSPNHSTIGGKDAQSQHNPLEAVGLALFKFIVDRRENPQDDVLTKLANSKFRDGSLPPVEDVITIASFLFAAGQDTTVRLITTSLQILGDNTELQRKLRENRDLIPKFIEEVLRIESPSKVGGFRLAKVRTKIGDIDVEPGMLVMPMIGATNRDPKRFEDPNEFHLDRKNSHDHLAFGRGIHSCVGAPLARAEARIALNRLFDRTKDLCISEEKHGPLAARRYEYMPRYTGRGLLQLYVEVTPA